MQRKGPGWDEQSYWGVNGWKYWEKLASGGGVDKCDIWEENKVGNDLEMTTKNKMNEEAAVPPDNLLILNFGF